MSFLSTSPNSYTGSPKTVISHVLVIPWIVTEAVVVPGLFAVTTPSPSIEAILSSAIVHTISLSSTSAAAGL